MTSNDLKVLINGNKDKIKISEQDVLTAMNKIQTEIWGYETKSRMKRSKYYRGCFVIHPDESKHYGVKKLFKEIVKAKNCKEDTTTLEEMSILNELGFSCGVDLVIHRHFYKIIESLPQ